MHRFRLQSATLAVQYRNGEAKGIATMIPAGSAVTPLDPIELRSGFDRSKLIAVEWDGKTVCMFLLDLLERGAQVDAAGS
jgi:hypothetical protein